jgi:hypothetical protein
MAGSFFARRPPASRQPDTPRRSIRKPRLHLPSPASDRLLVEARNLRHQHVASVSDPIGLQGHEPPALLFVESAQQDVDLLVQRPVWMLYLFVLAVLALTLMDLRNRHAFLAINDGFPRSEHHTLQLLRHRLPVTIKPGS